MQPKREAKLLTVIELPNVHAVSRITFMLYPCSLYMSKSNFTKLSAKIIASIHYSEFISKSFFRVQNPIFHSPDILTGTISIISGTTMEFAILLICSNNGELWGW